MSRIIKSAMDGVLAGMTMAMLAMVATLLRGGSPWKPVKLMAATFEGPSATAGGRERFCSAA